MQHMAVKRSRQSVRRLHNTRVAKASGQPSGLSMALGTAVFLAALLGFLSYSTSRNNEAMAKAVEARSAQVQSTEDQAATIRNSLNGSSVDAAIRKSEGF